MSERLALTALLCWNYLELRAMCFDMALNQTGRQLVKRTFSCGAERYSERVVP